MASLVACVAAAVTVEGPAMGLAAGEIRSKIGRVVGWLLSGPFMVRNLTFIGSVTILTLLDG